MTLTNAIPVVLAPGYMLDRDMWVEFEACLSASSEPRFSIQHADLTQDNTIEAMAERLLADAPEAFVLVGFSMGGYVAREVVRLAPKRVIALVLVATSSEGDNEVQRRRKEAISRSFDPTRFAGLSRAAVLSSVAPAHEGGSIIARIQAMGDRLGGHVFQRQSALIRTSDTDRLDQIGCPTLIVAGAEDRLRSQAESRTLQAGIPNSQLVVVRGAGHMIPLETADAFAAIVMPWLQATIGDLAPPT